MGKPSEERSSLMEQSRDPMPVAWPQGGRSCRVVRARVWGGLAAVGFSAVLSASAWAQAPVPYVPEVTQRSGLVQRFAGTPEVPAAGPPPRQLLQHPVRRQRDDQPHQLVPQPGTLRPGLEDARAPRASIRTCTGRPARARSTQSSRPWWRPLRFFQGLAHPWRPVGMYYQMGTYVPIYDLDPIAPGPGPYPYPFYFNWVPRRLSRRRP